MKKSRCCNRSGRSRRIALERSLCAGSTGPGPVDGKAVPGYRQEPGVKPDSATETFVALKLQVDNWRWSGVPFYLRTGKRLKKAMTEIAIEFKPRRTRCFTAKNRS